MRERLFPAAQVPKVLQGNDITAWRDEFRDKRVSLELSDQLLCQLQSQRSVSLGELFPEEIEPETDMT